MSASFDFLEGDGVGEAKGFDVDEAPLSNFLLSDGDDDGSSTRDLFEEDEEEDEMLGSGLFLLLCSGCSEDI
jgi:hypothetical protein